MDQSLNDIAQVLAEMKELQKLQVQILNTLLEQKTGRTYVESTSEKLEKINKNLEKLIHAIEQK